MKRDFPEAAFQAELALLFLQRFRVAALVLVALHSLAFYALDSSRAGPIALAIMIGVIPFTLALMAASYLRAFRAHGHVLALVLVFGLAAFIIWNNATFAHPLATEALLLLLPASSLLFPFRARASLVIGGLTMAIFIGMALLMSFGDARGIGASTFYIFCATVIATIGSGIDYQLRRKEFGLRHEVELARQQVENLLHNTLPAPIVERLKDAPDLVADRHDQVTVLFTDIVGFTQLSAEVPAVDLVRFLNDLFLELDTLTEQHGLEKVKTIGDAYMVAAGLPGCEGEAPEAARMALDILELARRMRTPLGKPLHLRVGLHTGPLVAGVIGRRRLTYDLWGDTVNTAARMESYAEPDTVHVSEVTRALLEDEFDFEPREPLDIKGKGRMQTHILRGHKSESRASKRARSHNSS
ncbi:MAG: adenylate/guanylate cyclase domain-containing protein [Polyangiaceae bacterium]